jgi:hypothetical protein
MFYQEMPIMIPVLATGYLVLVYGLLELVQRRRI